MNRMVDTSQNDRVQDGRHLMNGEAFSAASQAAEEDALLRAWRNGVRLSPRDCQRAIVLSYQRAFERTGEPPALKP